MDNRTLKILEYDKVLQLVSGFCVTEQAKAEILSTEPIFELNEAELLQETTAQAIVAKEHYLVSLGYTLDDICPILEKAEIGICLQPSDFLKIANIIKSTNVIKKSLIACDDDIVLIKNIISFLMPDVSLLKRIEETIGGENEIRDSASDSLRTIRRKIVVLNNKIKEKLNSYTHNSNYVKFLQDGIITVREGRFVLPVKSEYKSGIPGLIHDHSASGATLYIEPFPIVEMNNELKALQFSERDEIERILKVLTSEVALSSNGISVAYRQLILLDAIFAKAKFSVKFNCVKPILNNRGIIDLKACRHPLIENSKVVPIDISFGQKKNIVVITGPNTGGKTVSMKTVGLFSLLALSGIELPAESAEIAIFDNIFCDLGDEQSIAQSLSSFSSHITNIVHITDNVTPKSLVLIDEIGAGTDPAEGSALAIGILKYLELIDCRAIITTHYNELKEYSLTANKLINASMQFDEDTLRPTYKLIVGLPGVSNALKIAGSLGINDFILNNAKNSLSDNTIQFENILANAEKVKKEALFELENIRKLKADLLSEQKKREETLNLLNSKLAQINNNAKMETQKIVRRASEKAEEILDEMKEKLKATDEAALLEAKKLQKQLSDMQYNVNDETITGNYISLNKSDIKIGETVIIKSLNSKAVITSMPDKKGLISVISGSMSFKLPIDDLAVATQNKTTNTLRAADKHKCNNALFVEDAAVIEEISVLGMTVSEAIEVIEPYLLSSSMSNPKPIFRIVHGKGSGTLGKGIQSYLRKKSCVGKIRYGGYGEGGSGVTFVEMK